MFTIEQIDEIHARLGSAATLADYLRALNAIGVERYESFVTDGHSEYFGKQGYKVVSPPAHEPLVVAGASNREAFLEQLELHAQGQTDYFEMSRGLAGSGVEKWAFDTRQMTMIYYDQAGNELLTERID